MTFTDKFSSLSQSYALQRPRYPEALYDWLVSLTPAHELVWDCATGNGQAAVALARRFRSVIATDASAAMIESAQSHDRVVYRVAPAEVVPFIADHSLDLVTVATAIHWFDLDRFYAQVRRALKPDGVVAVWSYADSRVTPEIDRVSMRLNHEILREFWAPNLAVVNSAYRDLPFPFREIEPPETHMEVAWTLADFLNYHRTWSAAADYLKATGEDAVGSVAAEIGALWGDPDTRRQVSWPLFMRTGRP